MADEWGKWQTHDGSGCPVPEGIECETFHADGGIDRGLSCGHNCSGWSWYFCVSFGSPGDKVLRYRIRRPKALIDMIERAESLPVIAPEYEGVQS